MDDDVARRLLVPVHLSWILPDDLHLLSKADQTTEADDGAVIQYHSPRSEAASRVIVRL